MEAATKLSNVGLIFGLLLSLEVGFCFSQCVQEQSEVLNCKLRTLASSLNESLSSVHSASEVTQRTQEVKISCSEKGIESILRTNHFGYLPHLKELSIESCLVKKMPALAFSGLSGLQGLNFVENVKQTKSEIEGRVILNIEQDAFTGLNDLRSLNFSGNNIWTLPKAVFCSLSNLNSLDLSGNFIQDVSDLGFASSQLNSCRIPLRNLDLSHNSLSTLSSKVI